MNKKNPCESEDIPEAAEPVAEAVRPEAELDPPPRACWQYAVPNAMTVAAS